MNEEIFYKPEEIANKLKISTYKLYEMVKKDEIASYHIGKSIRISSAQFRAYMMKSKKTENVCNDNRNKKNNEATPKMTERFPAIMTSELFAGFKKSARDIVCTALQPEIRDYYKGETIINNGDCIDYIAVVCRGKVAKSKIDPEGTQLLEVIGKSKVFGTEIVSAPLQISAFEIKSCEATTIMRFNYDRILNDRSISEKYRIQLLDNIFHILADDNANNLHKIELASERSLRTKILKHLNYIKEANGKDKFCIGMDREQFSRYLCVDSAELSNELSRMVKQGLIYYHKDVFTLLDKKID